jgi:hypothetical protein
MTTEFTLSTSFIMRCMVMATVTVMAINKGMVMVTVTDTLRLPTMDTITDPTATANTKNHENS